MSKRVEKAREKEHVFASYSALNIIPGKKSYNFTGLSIKFEQFIYTLGPASSNSLLAFLEKASKFL